MNRRPRALVLALSVALLPAWPAPAMAGLCKGLTKDRLLHPMTPLARPALGQAVLDPEFGTTIRRITAVGPVSSGDAVIKPMYSTVAAWNADDTRLLLH